MLKEKTEKLVKGCDEIFNGPLGKMMTLSDIEKLDSETFDMVQMLIRLYHDAMDLAVAQAGLLDEMNKKLDAVNQKLSK